MTVLIAPDVEKAATSYLRSELSARGFPATVATRVPASMPALMVRVELTGGTRRDVVTDRPQITVEVWHSSSVTASQVARLAEALMLDAAGETAGSLWVRRVESVGGAQDFPDPDTNRPRYMFTVRWHVRPTPEN